MQKRGQVTIFIIIGVFIIAAVALFFIFQKGVKIPGVSGGAKEVTPTPFLQTCLEDKILEGVEILSYQGGSINPILNTRFKFDEDDSYYNISYLCYTHGSYGPCMNQQPMLIQSIKEEISDYISSEVEMCMSELVLNLEEEGFIVDAQYGGFDIQLSPGEITANIDAVVTSTKSEETSIQENFEISIETKLYDLSLVAQEISSQWARFCSFEHLGYMLTYPKYNIDIYGPTEGTVIYTIKDIETREKFRLAIRGCATAPGLL